MENRETDRIPGRRRSGFGLYLVFGLLLVVVAISAFVFFFSPESIRQLSSSLSGQNNGQQTSSETDQGVDSADSSGASSGTVELSDVELNGSLPGTRGQMAGTEGGPSPDESAEDSQAEGSSKTDLTSCHGRADTIIDFFNTLDTRDYMRAFELNSPSRVYFPQLIQKLIDNPPIVSGETDDLFTILQNTAHFFRILGKKNILLLKGILDRERDTFEQVLADFYLLTEQPDCLQERFNLRIGQQEMYSYAGFFLNTMGGRLYLFRRDSMSRMVVSYYAILIVEQANREGRNTYGIEIKDAIDNLIIEIESSRIKLKMRYEYLDTLYDLKVKYQ
jgi:hypothetical protein